MSTSLIMIVEETPAAMLMKNRKDHRIPESRFKGLLSFGIRAVCSNMLCGDGIDAIRWRRLSVGSEGQAMVSEKHPMIRIRSRHCGCRPQVGQEHNQPPSSKPLRARELGTAHAPMNVASSIVIAVALVVRVLVSLSPYSGKLQLQPRRCC